MSDVLAAYTAQRAQGSGHDETVRTLARQFDLDAKTVRRIVSRAERDAADDHRVPRRAPQPDRQEDHMSTLTVPASPRATYEQLRAQGHDHAEAAERVGHAYSRKPSEMAWLPNARDEWEERHAAAEPEPAPAAPPEPAEPDPFLEKEAAARGEIVRLTDLRAGLALDALTDPSKAEQLTAVESELEGAERGLAWAEEARREQARRRLAADDAEKAAARGDALRRAGELQGEREKAAARVDQAALAFGHALAAHQALAMEQANVLGALGGYSLERVLPPSWALGGALARALTEASAPVPDMELIRDPRPLAETDRRPVEPVVKSKPKGK